MNAGLIRCEATGQDSRVFGGDFVGAQIAIGMIPGADPVDRPGNGKQDRLGIARTDRAIGNTFFDVASERQSSRRFMVRTSRRVPGKSSGSSSIGTHRPNSDDTSASA